MNFESSDIIYLEFAIENEIKRLDIKIKSPQNIREKTSKYSYVNIREELGRILNRIKKRYKK